MTTATTSGRTPLCPVCSAPTRRRGYVRTRHALRHCPGCSHTFATATESELAELYSAQYRGFREDTVFDERVRSLLERHILPQTGAGASLLDVGCGNGSVLRIASRLGFESKGIDISAAAVALCKSQGFDAEVVDFATRDLGKKYDLVTFWDVLEHLIQPKAFIEAAARALRPGGWLLIKVPHHRALSLAVSALVPPVGTRVLATPAHLQFFTTPSLSRLLGGHFSEIRWIALDEGLRSPNRGGSLRRRMVRASVRAIQRLSGDGNLLALARRTEREFVGSVS